MSHLVQAELMNSVLDLPNPAPAVSQPRKESPLPNIVSPSLNAEVILQIPVSASFLMSTFLGLSVSPISSAPKFLSCPLLASLYHVWPRPSPYPLTKQRSNNTKIENRPTAMTLNHTLDKHPSSLVAQIVLSRKGFSVLFWRLHLVGLRDHMRFWGSNPDMLYARQEPYPRYYLSENYFS